MWVRFVKDFDFSPGARNGRVTIAYKAGMRVNVTRECHAAAHAAGALEEAASREDTEPRTV